MALQRKNSDFPFSVQDPANRICDAPGSWYCNGQYPPALSELISRRKDFAQLEDFNKKRTEEDEAYTKAYMARMNGEVPADDFEEFDFNEPTEEQEQQKPKSRKDKLKKKKIRCIQYVHVA
eukprot:SAG31_NODE_7653_length_1629_cov_1.011765_1_plen_121_part_00